MIRVLKRNKIFIRFALSYIFILFIYLIIGVVAYSEMLKISKADSIQAGLLSLDKEKELVEARFAELDNTVIQLTLNEDIRTLVNIYQPLENSDFYEFKKIQEKLYSYKLTNSFIDDIYMFMENPGVIISSKYISTNVPMFYTYFMNYKDMEFADWKNKVMDTYHYMDIWPANPIIKENNESDYITYIQSYPVGSYTNYRGAIIIHIHEEKFNQYFSSMDIIRDGSIIVLDQENKILSSINYENKQGDINKLLGDKSFEEINIGDENTVVMRTNSNYRYWNYIAAIPVSYFESKAIHIKKVFGLTILLILIVGFISAVFLAYRNSSPIRKVIESLNNIFSEEGHKSTQDFSFLEGTISRLIHHNESLKEQWENQIPFIKASFLERLLKGGLNSSQEIHTLVSHVRLNLEGEGYIVILMKVNGFYGELTEEDLKELDIAKVIVSNALQEAYGDEVVLHNIDEDKVSMIKILNSFDEQQIQSGIEVSLGKFRQQLYDEYDIRLSFSVGNMYRSLLEISRSFHEASRALEYKYMETNRKIQWYKDIPVKNAGYSYPLDLEQRLMNLTRNGEKEAVLNEIHTVQLTNFEQLRLSENEMIQLYYEIRGTVIKVKGEISTELDHEEKVNKLIEKMDSYETAEELFRLLTKIYEYLCELVKQKKSLKSVQLTDEIIKFIIAHYNESDLCLYSVASEFDLSEKYLSQFFKDHTGGNFTAFVESIRMEKAVQLLMQTKLSVKDIAVKVGYERDNTFYRAFKRFHGLSPTNYKKGK